MTTSALVVADDLTGAMDAGSAFAARGHRTTVAVGRADDDTMAGGGVLVVDTDSRHRPPEAARAAVERAVERTPAQVVYKKVDSTLRGNVASETAGALSAAGVDCALVAPAFPATGRLTAAGYHLVDGALVTESTASDDPERPSDTAHLPTLLSGTDFGPVTHLNAGTVAAGSDAVREAIESADARLLVCDAVHGDHLASLAAGAADADRSVVYAGSAGLADAVHLPPGAAPADPPNPPEDARVLGIAGSINPVTVAQVAALSTERVVALDATRAVTDPEGAAEAAATEARDRLAGGCVVTSVREEDDVAAVHRAADREGVDPDEACRRITRALGECAATLAEHDPPDGLLLTGGAVAGAAFDALGTDAVALTGETIAAGIPVGRVQGGSVDGAGVVTKAGGFGDERALADALARLGGRDE